MASIAVQAGVPDEIKKDSPIQKELQLSLTHKDSPQDQNKVMITVSFLGDNDTIVSLVDSSKNGELTTVLEDGKVSVSFEIEKSNLEKSFLRITDTDPTEANARCVRTLLLYLKEHVV
jgi:hypothetical protein